MKKNNGKTAEELLQEALVPVEEQPYPIPKNWIWLKSEYVAKWGSGGTPSRKNPDYYGGDIPWIKTGNLRNGIITEVDECITDEGLKKSSAKVFPKGSVAIAMYGATIGKLGILGFDSSTNQACAVGVPLSITTTKFLFYYFLSQKDELLNLGKGGAQPNISQQVIKKFPFALPPLAEQERIVQKVERLLNKISQAKQLIQEAKETFELRRAAILDKAFRGELTESWRTETKGNNCVVKSHVETMKPNEDEANWILTNFDSIITNEKYALAIGPFGSNLKVADYTDKGVPLIFVRNIRSSNYELDNKFVSEKKALELKAHVVESGDILVTKMGDPPGDVDICPDSIKKAIITSDCIKLRVNPEIVNNRYVLYAIKSEFVQKQIRRESKGVAQQKISLQAFRKMKLMVAPYKEQLKIVEKLDDFTKKEEQSFKSLGLLERKLILVEQAILSKAFKGQLGTNNSFEESIMELLQLVKKR